MPFGPGQRINDYEILSVLGAGGMGRVYCVRNTISGRTEAMKVLLPDLSAEPDLAHRFTSEIRTLAGFDHPNIAQLRTAFQYENQLVMIMEYVEGVSLEQKAKQGPLPQAEVVDYMSQVLAALSYAHNHGVVHRDIKPANMMMTSHGIVKLMDFGIAKSSNEPQLTRPGMTMGSMYYMSPEQVRGTNVDARSDIYSVGITLYELLAGRRPFEAQTTFSILNQQLNEIPTPPVEVNAALPKGLNDIILMALAKDPEMRFQTADAFRNALRPFLREQPGEPDRVARGAAAPLPAFIPVPATPPLAGAQLKSSSRRGLWIGLGAVAAVLAMIAAATMIPRFAGTHAAPVSIANPDSSAKAAPTASIMGGNAPDPAGAPALTAGPSATPTSQTMNQHADQLPAATQEHMATPTQAITTAPTATAPRSQPTDGKYKQQPSAPRPAYRPDTQGSSSQMIAGTPSSGPQPVPQDASKEAMEQASERLLQLDAKSTAVSESIDSLRRNQEAQGLGLRGDIIASLNRMNAHKEAANRAMQQHDSTAANKYMEQAEGDLQTLERFMGR